MKKQLLKFAFATATAMLCGQVASAGWSEDRVLADPLAMQQGTEVDWVVCIENTDPLQAFQFDFALPEGVEVAKKANGKYNISLDSERIEDLSFSVVSNYLDELGVYRVAAYSPDLDVFNETTNRMVKIKLASTGEDVGNFDIEINNIVFTENKLSIVPEDTTASLTVYNPATSILLDPTSISLTVGETATFPTYTLDPANSVFGTTVKWEIPETDCIAIDEDGNIKAIAPTTEPVIITFTATNEYSGEALTAECSVEVAPILPSAVTISQGAAATIFKGLTLQLDAVVEPADATDPSVAWSVVDGTDYVSVSEAGLVTALAAGEAIVRCATVAVPEVYADIVITVEPVAESITLDSEEIVLGVSDAITLLATILPEEVADQEVVWESSDEAVATVDAQGVVTGVAQGKAEITAKTLVYADPETWLTSEPCVVVVKSYQTITWEPENTDMIAGDQLTLTATASSDLEVAYAITEGEDLASIEEGIIYFNLPGTIIVEASQAGDDAFFAAEPVCVTFTVVKQEQVIVWETPESSLRIGESLELVAVSDKNLEVTYTIVAGEECATIDGNILTATAAGTVSVQAMSSGSDTVEAAESAVLKIEVLQLTQAITWTVTTDVVVGDAVALDAVSTSGLELTYAITQGEDCAQLEADQILFTYPGIVTVVVSQEGNAEYEAAEALTVTFNVDKKAQSITWEQTQTTVEIGSQVELTAVASSALDVEYEIIEGLELAEIIDNVLYSNQAGDVTVRAIQAGNEYYYAAEPVELTFTMVKCAQEITLTTTAITLTAGNQVELEASATSGLPVSFAIIEGADYVSLNGNILTAVAEGSAVIEVSQVGNDQYAAAAPAYINITIEPMLGLGAISLGEANVSARDGQIVISGAEGQIVEVFTPAGMLVYRGTDNRVAVPSRSIYIVRIGAAQLKLYVR
ncbi:MAG: Ig-like domain-containing protein [Bacteroidales bacterium]|nr:Ig-like domain-containing protein [Bacteroidales bacterium]